MSSSPDDLDRDRMLILGAEDDAASCLRPAGSGCPSPTEVGKKLCSVFDSALGQTTRPTPTGEPVQVFLRLRPLPEGDTSAIEVKPDGKTVRATAPPPLNERKEFRDPRDYNFTGVMDGTTTQTSMYNDTAADIVDNFSTQGKSGLIFTYGVTNAGKSHTMLGSKEDPGLLPRSVQSTCSRQNFDQQV
jgi:hypothetical protein